MTSCEQNLKPLNPGFVAEVERSFAAQPIMDLIGARLSLVEPGVVEITLPYCVDLTQQDGYLHAGIVTTIADSACGYACLTRMPEGSAVLSVEFKINLLAPARGPRFRFEGVVVKPGRTITVVEGRALQFEADGSAEKLVATMSATVMTVQGREALKH